MAGKIVKDDIDALRDSADIVAIVGEHTTLKRAGKRYSGLCPFHTERTPSFSVTPEGNFYTCFGCGVSGDIYDFVMRTEGLAFPDAVEHLARRFGFTLRYEQMTAGEQRRLGERSRLVEVTTASAEFFRAILYTDDGAPARDYLKSRGFGRDEAEAFTLGYAPNDWEALSRHLSANDFRAEEIIAAGMAVRTDRGGLRDRFRGRLIFPIHDAGGDVIGFGGRVLPGLDYGDFEPPKYLNSSETPLYRKSRVLYGLYQARGEIARTQSVLVCEGYTDVMALHQAGFTHAVATCGTAVGADHLRLVARYAKNVVLAFDGDAAGVKAAERAWEALRSVQSEGSGVDVDLRVLALDTTMDPADLVREQGAEGVSKAFGEAAPIVPFVIRHRLAEADRSTEQGRTKALHDAIDVLAREPDQDMRRAWARTEIAEALGVAYDFVTQSAKRRNVTLDAHEGVAVQRNQTRDVRPDAAAGVRQLERAVLRAAVQYAQLLPEAWFSLDEAAFGHPHARAVWRAIAAAGGAGTALGSVLEHADDDEIRGIVRALALEDDPEVVLADDEASRVVATRVQRLAARRLTMRIDELSARLSQLNYTTDPDAVRTVQRELAEIERQRRELTQIDK
ncbi:MAG: DNA primase [Nitriliruptoraceae bacterium]